MKKVIVYIVVIMFFSLSCKKEKENIQQGSVEFNVALNENSSLKTTLNVQDVSYILVDITKDDGTPVYTSKKIELIRFENNYISTPFALNPGTYAITRFLVLDENESVVYACPKSGSEKAYLVTNPLDLEFTVNENQVTKLLPEVLSVEGSTPASFGYFDASFEVKNTFDFLVGVFIYDEALKNFKLSEASITISGDSLELYSLSLSDRTNKITVNDGYSEYKVSISKAGYESYVATYTVDSLKACFSYPLIVILEKPDTSGLVAYYPFNGNANDESGFGNNGNVFGATLAADRFGNLNKSYFFNGIDNYIILPVEFDILPRTINLWYNAAEIDYGTSYGAIYQSDNPNLIYGNTGIAIKTYDSGQRLLLTISGVTDTVDFVNNEWFNATIVVDDTKTIKYFINGEFISEKTFENYLNSVNGLEKTIIGASRISTNCYFKGMIDDIRIYNRALSAEEISLLYHLDY